MARRRVQDGQAQGELAGAGMNGTSETVSVYLAENTEANRAEVARRVAAVASASLHSAPAAVVNNAPSPAPETVSCTWGEELFTPVQFCSFRVGPFSAMTALRPGESRDQAADRLMRELEKIAAREREVKARVFADSLGKITGKGRP